MKKYLLALPCLMLAGTSHAQSIRGCNPYYTGSQVYKATSIPNLTKERDCFEVVERQAKISKESRDFQIDRLSVVVPPVVNPKDYVIDVGVMPRPADKNDVGAFRVTLQPTDYGFNDSILYPGVKNGSPHGHSNYGVYGIDENTTTESLLKEWKGGYNPLLGSAYWAPWLQRIKDGKIIQYDYVNVYYKRYGINDPRCYKEAAKGCIPLIHGIRMIAGYDMKRMHEVQPEYMKHVAHRCISSDKKAIDRQTLAEAIADCQGSGDLVTAIAFPSCSDGRKDSPNHRDHLAYSGYYGNSYAECPSTHPYSMTGLTQLVKYTIEADDGPVAFSSDVTPGMPAMIPGTTFHADYVFGLRKEVEDGIERCLNGHLSCSSGDLGDTTQLKAPATFTLKANPRVIDPPKR